MTRPYYGDSLDGRILELFEAGATYRDMGATLGVSHEFLSKRAVVLGIREGLAARGLALRTANRRSRVGQPRGARVLGRLGAAGRTDDTASRIYRRLRSHRPDYASAWIDFDNVVACLFARGLTLPEIHEAVGVPPIEAVAAIRAHHGSLAA